MFATYIIIAHGRFILFDEHTHAPVLQRRICERGNDIIALDIKVHSYGRAVSFFGLFARRCIRVRPCVNMCGPHFRPNKCRDTYFIISHRAIPFLLSFQLGSIYFFASLCFFFSDFTARGIKRGDTCIHRERIKCV